MIAWIEKESQFLKIGDDVVGEGRVVKIEVFMQTDKTLVSYDSGREVEYEENTLLLLNP